MAIDLFHFAKPIWLVAIFIGAVVALLYALYYRDDGGAKLANLENFADKHLLPHLVIGATHRKKSTLGSIYLWFIIWSLMCFAMAGPRWSYREFESFSKEQKLVVLLDLSRSMDADDVKPSRLTRARSEIEDILRLNPDVKIGLSGFAAHAHMIAPLTSDHDNIRRMLPLLGSDLIHIQGSRLKPALKMAEEMLIGDASIKTRYEERQYEGKEYGEKQYEERRYRETSYGQNSGNAIVILTDGGFQDNESFSLARSLAAKGVKIYVIGIGTEEGINFTDTSGKPLIVNGKAALSKLEGDKLKELAKISGGYYMNSDYSSRNAEIIGTNMKQMKEQLTSSTQKSIDWDEGFYIFLLPVLVLSAFCYRRNFVFPFVLLLMLVPSIAAGGHISGSEKQYIGGQHSEEQHTEGQHVGGQRSVEQSGEGQNSGEQLAKDQLSKEQKNDRGIFEDIEARILLNDQNYAKKLIEEERAEEALEYLSDPYSRGIAHYKAGNYNEAAIEFEKNLRTERADDALYNLGNALAMQEKYSEAIATYERLLERNEKHVNAKYNLEYLKKLTEGNQSKQGGGQGKDDNKREQQESEQPNDNQKQDDQKNNQEGDGEAKHRQGKDRQGKDRQGKDRQGENSKGKDNQGNDKQGDEKDKGDNSDDSAKDKSGEGDVNNDSKDDDKDSKGNRNDRGGKDDRDAKGNQDGNRRNQPDERQNGEDDSKNTQGRDKQGRDKQRKNNQEKDNQRDNQRSKDNRGSSDDQEGQQLNADEVDIDEWLDRISDDYKNFLRNQFYIESQKEQLEDKLDPW